LWPSLFRSEFEDRDSIEETLRTTFKPSEKPRRAIYLVRQIGNPKARFDSIAKPSPELVGFVGKGLLPYKSIL
jgi:hypothetical protein